MPSILLTNYYSKAILSLIKKEVPPGFTVISLDSSSKEEVRQKAAESDYFLVGGRIKIDKYVIENAPRLKMVQRSGVGMDSVDLDVLKARNIPVYINHGVNSRSVAEHTLMLMLSVLRRLNISDSSLKKGDWVKHELGVQNFELFGKTVGLIGMGNIGECVAEMLTSFGTNTLYFKPNRLSQEKEDKLGLSYRSFEKLLSESDIVSIHCSLNDQTRSIIGDKEFKSMKGGSFIINTSRGAIIDEKALVKNLKSGHLSGAGLDVYEQEPLPADSYLRELDNVILTPHIGGITHESFTAMIRSAFRNISLYENGELELIERNKI
ncbi:2-hydroxyacid dehydrogenase [Algoriphagus sp. NG3]|uniref:2-hydroxyacid dehydrogenase n=1 Tax=Algoriphagus sp. NG3 TaxID=3097546 RepID=UPI002A83F10E|nr:2-hydroxyacid dehydrogenase [Algoriphagus sp. NG3]WPR77837.1 2-hydroxyacid dehydrogenase [Algoriphagus sp. NG3]